MESSERHPAAVAVREYLTRSGRSVAAVRLLHRGTVVAVIADTDTAQVSVIIEAINGRWDLSDLISEHGWGPPLPRRALTAHPPRLMWDSLATSGPPGRNGERPAAVWAVLTGQAARDAQVLTVKSDVEVRTCEVHENGSVAVLFRKSWNNRPRLTMQTISGEDVPLFNGESGIPG